MIQIGNHWFDENKIVAIFSFSFVANWDASHNYDSSGKPKEEEILKWGIGVDCVHRMEYHIHDPSFYSKDDCEKKIREIILSIRGE